MYSFVNDYLEGCHPKILEALTKTNFIQQSGYGSDDFCQSAIEKIKKTCECPEAQIYFVNGGTQTNQLVIDTMLNKYEGVIAAATGHINMHEAGAIEFTGHKVLTVPSYEGKVKASDVKKYLQDFYQDGNYEHMVFPGMLYISFPTEYGSLYTKDELVELSEICKEYQIPFFIDGARLGYGLMAKENDVTLPLIAKLADVFYIGGTKIGALCGEAIVFTKNNAPKHFVTHIKQHGALTAKGRLYGVQFDTLFTDNLYFEISKHALEMADRIKAIFKEKNFKFFIESPTNQQFIILDNAKKSELEKKIQFSFWEKYDDTHTVVRFATSWATTEESLIALKEALED